MAFEDITETLWRHDGIMRTRALEKLGISKHRRALAVDAGAVERVGRSWLAVPGTDRHLGAAARAGVVLTCVTQAKRLGLWVLEEDVAHVAAPAHGRVRTEKAHVHWNAPPVPRDPDSLVDPVENVLTLVAYCQPHDAALAIWESALRQQLVSLEAMRALSLPPTARALRDEAVPWSDSGLESFVVPRLSWLNLPITPQVWIAGHRVDFLIGERLVLQIDGGHHVGAQRTQDVAHDAELMLLGYHVVRVTYTLVVERWHEVQAKLMRAVAQGLHRAA